MSIFRLLTDFEGRIGRSRFWLGSALVALALLAIQKIAPLLVAPQAARQYVAFAGAFALFPWAALAAKRATDRGGAALFGILLVCAIVLPGQLRPYFSSVWGPSLDTVALIAWVVALLDLGLMPSAAQKERIAEPAADAKATAWTQLSTPPSPSTPPIPSP
ncbi:DUF805 domain-containing protein [Bosea sp. PAMC 26642]|uniref:DUF805 domain-containing protein n=1 Tax=Bosea sp. (strain PAMC 26642) TaxID=1792307 RepID=UPI0007703A48|nr:DUF805 domain-containing protein [Bosea sp. PAMC 26642]AMJ63122.1 hypothetical protein AXW83_24965 [Bosea sp. PAMC 26642]